jgi:hypothetical protein
MINLLVDISVVMPFDKHLVLPVYLFRAQPSATPRIETTIKEKDE